MQCCALSQERGNLDKKRITGRKASDGAREQVKAMVKVSKASRRARVEWTQWE